MRFGIFGGAFDPPHAGHRKVALAAQSALGLDAVYWVPTQDPPHKNAPASPFVHRLAMVRLAIAGLAGHLASDIEARLPRPSYTLNTIRALKAERGAAGTGDDWFLLIGADNWSIFPQWHRPEEVLREATPVVYPRGGGSLPDTLPEGVIPLDTDLTPESSSAIREALARGASSAAAGVLPELAAYVADHGLYAGKGAA